MLFCTLLHQPAPNRVEVFAFGTIGAMGDVPESLVSISTAEAMASLWENAYCAEMKKLTRLLIAVHYSRPTQPSASSSSSGSFDIVASGGDGRSCAQCLKVPVAKFVAISSRPKQCALCMARVSSNCRVKKTMGFPPAANHAKKMAKPKRNICMQCIPRFSKTSSAVFTVLDTRAARGETVDYIGTLKFVLGCHGRRGLDASGTIGVEAAQRFMKTAVRFANFDANSFYSRFVCVQSVDLS